MTTDEGTAGGFEGGALRIGLPLAVSTLVVSLAAGAPLAATPLRQREAGAQSIPGAAGDGGVIRGTVRDATGGLPLAGVEIVVLPTGPRTVTGEAGEFELRRLDPGLYRLEARRPGFTVERSEEIRLAAGGSAEVSFELLPAATALDEIAVTPSRFEILRREPARSEQLSREQVERLPHLFDDVYRAVTRLPGTAGGDVSARFHIRGGEEEELLVLLDGLELYEPFHFKDFLNVVSIVDSRAVGEIELYTGGYPVEYGDRMSGVMDITLATPGGDRRTALGLSFLNALLLGQGTFARERGSWLVSARRGYLDLALDLAGADAQQFEPDYVDVLSKVQLRLGDRNLLSAHVLAAHDDIEFASDNDEVADGVYDNAYVWLHLASSWSGRVSSRTVLWLGRVDRKRRASVESGDVEARVDDRRALDLYGLKQDWVLRLSDRQMLKLGFEAGRLEAEYDYFNRSVNRDPLFGGGAGTPPAVTGADLDLAGDDRAAYAAYRMRPADPLILELGVRWDEQTHADDEQVSPRVNAVYHVGERSSLRAAWGRFHQAQRIDELQVPDGVTEFFPAQRAEHRLIGFEHAFEDGATLRAEVYRKELSALRPRFENLLSPFELIPEAEPDRVRLAPSGGRAEGLELLLSWDRRCPVTGWASYVYSSAEDEIDGVDVPRSWDQRHTLNLDLNWRLSERWNLHASWLYHSGWPTTAITAELVENPDGSVEVDPRLGPRNGERLPDFHRLDLRLSRAVPTARGTFRFFVEVFNVYDRDNLCCFGDLDFLVEGHEVRVVKEEEYWLPLLPSFGLSWEL